MCFDLDSRPPIAPIAGGAIDATPLILTAADRNRFAAYRARAADPTGAGVVILPDVRGLHPYYEELRCGSPRTGSTRWPSTGSGGRPAPSRAATGSSTLRTSPRRRGAGSRPTSRRPSRSCGRPRAAGRHPARCSRSGSAWAAGCRSWPATLGLGLAGAIGLYGTLVGPWRNDAPAPVDLAGQIDVARPGAVRRRGRGRSRPRRSRRSTRPGRRGRRPPARDLPRRAAQLLRPQGARVRRRQRGGVGRGPRVHPGGRGRDLAVASAGATTRASGPLSISPRPRERDCRGSTTGRHGRRRSSVGGARAK